MTSISSGDFRTQDYASLYRAGRSPALDPASVPPAGGSPAAFVALQSALEDRARQDPARQDRVTAPPSATESLMQTLQAHSLFTAQRLGQEDETAGPQGITADAEEDSESPAAKAFLEYMAKSTGEKFFERFLAGKGMTQEDFDALSPEKQKALLQEFQEAMKRDLEEKTAEKLNKTRSAGLF
jgi:hypothetical protein